MYICQFCSAQTAQIVDCNDGMAMLCPTCFSQQQKKFAFKKHVLKGGELNGSATIRQAPGMPNVEVPAGCTTVALAFGLLLGGYWIAAGMLGPLVGAVAGLLLTYWFCRRMMGSPPWWVPYFFFLNTVLWWVVARQ